MEFWALLVSGLRYMFDASAIMVVILGVAFGIVLGAAPGLGPTVGTALVLPLVLRLSPELGILLMVAIHVGAEFGNSIPAVLIRVPGTPAATLTVLEGYPFQERGEGGRALMVSLLASVTGQLISLLVFALTVIPVARLAVKFLFPEMFALVVFGLLAAVGLSGVHRLKGLAAICFGLLLSVIGVDPMTGRERFAFGMPELSVGLDTVAVLMGLLAMPEVFRSVFHTSQQRPTRPRLSLALPRRADVAEAMPQVLVGTAVGTFVGALPGAGSAAASFIGYQLGRLVARRPERFGKGSIEGLAVADAANNAAVSGELIPTLGLGIPGSASMAVIMAALLAQGIIPGPEILATRPTLLHATVGGLLAGTVVLAGLGYLAIWPSVYVSRLSPAAVSLTTLVLVLVGVYSLNWSLFDMWVAVVIGVVAYFMSGAGYPIAPAALSFLLGQLMESNLRRGLVMAGGVVEFVTRPVTLLLLVLAVGTLFAQLLVPRFASAGAHDRGEPAAGELG